MQITKLKNNKNRKILILFGNEGLCKYKPFNEDSLEMKHCFSHIYPNNMKEISDMENFMNFTSEI